MLHSGNNINTKKMGRFRTNFISNVGFFAINILIGLWYTPYLIKHLGTASYGIIPLVKTITGYMLVLTNSINAAVSRYIMLSLSNGDHDEANAYFNTSLFGSIFVIIFLLPVIVAVTFYLEAIVKLPPGQMQQARLLFLFVAFAFLMNTLRTPFGVSTYYMNRFDLRTFLNATDRIISISLVVLLFSVLTPQIWMVGLGLVLGMAVICVGDFVCWRRLTPSLNISPSFFLCSKLRALTSTGVWVSVDSIGVILFLGIDLMVVNHMFGPESGGRYAAVLQWSMLLRSIATVIAAVFGPKVMHLYAKNEIDSLISYMKSAVKCLGLLIALPIGLISGLSAPLLATWLGPDFVDLAGLMMVLTIHLGINLAVIPLFRVNIATNRMRIPSLVVLCMGIGNLALAILLAGPVGWGLYGVAAAGAISLSAKNILFTPAYAARVLGQKYHIFIREIAQVTFCVIIISVLAKVSAMTIDLAGWWRLITFGILLSALYALAAYFFILNKNERQILIRMIPEKSS